MGGAKNFRTVEKAFKEFRQQIDDTVYAELDKTCRNLLLNAVVANRRGNPKAHQFTGNLINSIVVILFRKSEGTQDNYFAYDDLKAPIRKEMSAKTWRGTTRKRAVHFRPDWQGTPHSMYKPTVVTDESTGPQDARSFASSWSPETGKDFEICVAYTAEYAEFVEQERKATGYLNSVGYTKKLMRGLGLKQTA